ncbi:LLM class F420-dependent oxidoreductase [Labedaea rhizosphaerae]|uniref:Putative F420-dependent oxidoreductase n=1 Tax=Labedaea rhizosphaerae TaxID=598644 RepID=A0A4R6SJQ1_LABRH|nr:LLM class F420-dependent oxidoreductase [Labedaea rhizosphaerae]TDQ04556.1 putative F420-dependent oxidoreductase [Labedaea rhizosphaerae]
MKIGIILGNGHTPHPGELGRAVEQRGFESLFYPEHTHIPVRSKRADGTPTRNYARTQDPFVALAAAAAVTSHILLGTGVCLVPQRDPFTTAKAVATLDDLSGGRVLLGVGAGWNREEMADHGTDPRTRMALMAERVKAMRAIWTEDEASFHGEFVDFEPVWAWPKPARPVPVLVGGNGPGTEDRVLDFGDEWMPQCGPLETVDELRDRIARLRDRAGRYVPVTLFGVPHRRDLLDQFTQAGVDRCLLPIQGPDTATIMSTLDALVPLLG